MAEKFEVKGYIGCPGNGRPGGIDNMDIGGIIPAKGTFITLTVTYTAIATAVITTETVTSATIGTANITSATIATAGITTATITTAAITQANVTALSQSSYYWQDDFDDEAGTVQLESSLNADYWTTAGTNYAAGNVTYTAGVGGTLKAMCAAADNDSVTILGLLNFNTTQNPIFECRVKIDTKETAGFYVGLSSEAQAVIGTIPANCFLIGMDSDNAHSKGATSLIAVSNDDNAGAVYMDTGVDVVSDTYLIVKFDLTDTEQPRVWVNGTEVAAATILGTVKAATAMGVYFVVQNLAGGAIQRFITVDYVKVWADR